MTDKIRGNRTDCVIIDDHSFWNNTASIETDGKNLYWISENLESQQIKEPTQERLDEVEFIRKNYSEKEEWNKKGYIYQPSLLFGGVNKLMSWLQIYMEEDEVWKWLFGTFGVIIVLTLIFAFYVI